MKLHEPTRRTEYIATNPPRISCAGTINRGTAAGNLKYRAYVMSARLRDMRFSLSALPRADEKLRDLPGHNEIDPALIDQTLEAAARFAEERTPD